MAQYPKEVPKSPASCDETLKAVLDFVVFQTKDGDKLVDHQVLPDKVVLKFDDGEK
jgi:hypothetical protein